MTSVVPVPVPRDCDPVGNFDRRQNGEIAEDRCVVEQTPFHVDAHVADPGAGVGSRAAPKTLNCAWLRDAELEHSRRDERGVAPAN